MTTLPPSNNFAGEYDVVVASATPGGIAAAIRAAREGMRVLLVEPTAHVGGMWASGVQIFDTRYAGHRCPILTEFTTRLVDHYRRTSGEGSDDHALARFGDPTRHGQRPRFEPHVAERIFRDMLADTPGVRLVHGLAPVRVEKAGTRIRGVTFADSVTRTQVTVTGGCFVDASYEADLAALAGAGFRSGREGRQEFGEPHAGRHFTTIEPIGSIGDELARQLGLHYFNRTSRRQFGGSTGAADRAVQAYTARLVLTNRPENRRPIPSPLGYSRERYLGALDRTASAHAQPYPLSSHLLHGDLEALRLAPNLPRGKMDWLGANLVGGNHDYPTANASRRREIYHAHIGHALGLLYFLQHDPAVPVAVREHLREWGLSRDEYRDNDNLPHLIYVREARRLAGRHVFTQHDAMRHPQHGRTPIHPDAIAFAEWPMDSHDCNPVRQPGSCNDGEFILAEETLPAHIPFRVMVSDAVENLIVPVAMSSTHVGWGTLRLETVFVHTGEAAGVAAALCLRDNVAPAALRPSLLQAELLRRGVVVSYLAGVDLGSEERWVKDAQFLAARGFFAGYRVEPAHLVTPAKSAGWSHALARLLRGDDDANENAAEVLRALRSPDPEPTTDENASALLRRHGSITPLPFREAIPRLADAVRETESAGLSA
jgi:hypothetical protein